MTTSNTEKPKRAIYDKDIASRFAYFRKKYIGDTQSIAAKELKVPQSNISDMESGKQSIGYKVINRMIEAYRLNAEWLATGEGHPIAKPAPDTGGLMGKSIKTLEKNIRELETKLIQMEKSMRIMEVNQAHFIKRIEKFLESQQK
jgi:transcriptional regulator with XRE-family HTH domain